MTNDVWQPYFTTAIQEGAIDWDEEWDKFEDEGLSSFYTYKCILG